MHDSHIGIHDPNRSVLFYTHQDKVDKQWAENQKEKVQVKYVEPTSIDVNKIKTKYVVKTYDNAARQKKVIIDAVRSRYTHENKIVIFMAKCKIFLFFIKIGSVTLRGLSKHRKELNAIVNNFMYSSI